MPRAGVLYGPENDVRAVEGDWLILNHAGNFQSRLVAASAIVIGPDDGLSSTSHALFKCSLRLLGNHNGAN